MQRPLFPMRLRSGLRGSLLAPALALATFLLATAPPVDALQIVSTDLPQFGTSVDLGGATVSAEGGFFTHKTVGGFDSVGITGGFEGGEIDLSGESILVAFDTPQRVTELVLANLYVALEEDDVFNEQGLVRALFADGSHENYVISVAGPTSAVWNGPGTVSNVAPGLFAQGGVWRIDDPFGSVAVTGVLLLPTGKLGPTNFRNNDYGFVSLVAVPEPASLALLTLGLAGLGVAGRARTGRSSGAGSGARPGRAPRHGPR